MTPAGDLQSIDLCRLPSGVIVNHKKLRRLMREHNLQPKRRRRHVATTDSDHDSPIYPITLMILSPAQFEAPSSWSNPPPETVHPEGATSSMQSSIQNYVR
jgi:hypothetical protein